MSLLKDDLAELAYFVKDIKEINQMPHKMEKVMSEFKAGKLKSGGDKTVTKRKQAIAIGLAMEQKAHRKKSKKA